MRLLLLEDDPRLRSAFAARLRADGYAVDEVETLGEARAWLDRGIAFDGLVLDRRVPDGDSLQLVEEVGGTAGRPAVVVVSALGDGDERVRGLAVGADDYLVKPVRLDELVLRLQRLLLPRTRATTRITPGVSGRR
ncbi:MAG TPA: response regulator [Iamia sp.]|nr:response regulator [Iamia sp.]